MKAVLVVGGSNSIGGSGLFDDVNTINAHGNYATTVSTSIVGQNEKIFNANFDLVNRQLDNILNKFVVSSTKIGMLLNEELVITVCEKLKEHNCKNIVYDPMIISKSGKVLVDNSTLNLIIENLIPLADLITLNIFELELLTNTKIDDKEKLKRMARKLSTKYNKNILIKSCFSKETCDDLFFYNKDFYIFKGEKVNKENVQHKEFTLSSAIACNLANGDDIFNSIKNSKQFIINTLKGKTIVAS